MIQIHEWWIGIFLIILWWFGIKLYDKMSEDTGAQGFIIFIGALSFIPTLYYAGITVRHIFNLFASHITIIE